MITLRNAYRMFGLIFVVGLLAFLISPFATRPSSAQTGQLIGFAGISDGATVSGTLIIEAKTSGQVAKVVFRLSGPTSRSFTDNAAPYYFNGDSNGTPNGWDSTRFPNGRYTLRVTMTDSSGNRQSRQVSFVVDNSKPAPTQQTTVYSDSLDSAWANWSWDSTVDPSSTAQVQSGNAALAVTYNAPWAGLYLHHNGLDVSSATSLRFWIHGGGVPNRQISLALLDPSGNWTRVQQLSPPANSWTEVVVPFNGTFQPTRLVGIALQEFSGSPQPTFYLDAIQLTQPGGSPSQPQPTATSQPQPTATSQPQPTATSQPQPTATSQPQPTATSQPQPTPTGGYLYTFDGAPSAPQPWKPADWDVSIHTRAYGNWDYVEPLQAAHGADCAGPPASHPISRHEETVFICRNHVMTAISESGYGAIYLTPNQIVDFTQGEAVIRWDMSTLRTSSRDWVDVWITPYADNLQHPLTDWLPDLTGEPRNAIQVRLDFNTNVFIGHVIKDFQSTELPRLTWQGYEQVLVPDPARRDTFEIRISRTGLKVGMPAYNFWWVDTSFADLGWSSGVVQFGHHSYAPTKCDNCSPTTWHWDNVSISPAKPFTIIRADRRYADRNASGAVTFASPAPANAHLRFSGIGPNIQVSFDGGQRWQAAQIQNQELLKDEHFRSYWTPIPEGTRQVLFRGDGWWGGDWHVRDMTIWAPPL
ncbi:MAG: hypothetical protein OHK0015_04770 [Chloroflexi bacterium OHK40]